MFTQSHGRSLFSRALSSNQLNFKAMATTLSRLALACEATRSSLIGVAFGRSTGSCFKRRDMSTKLLDVDTPLIPLQECRRFITQCLMAVGTTAPHAEAMADLLVEADYRGHYSHGMNRLEIYINDVKNGTCDGNAVPKVLHESPATAWVDGQNGLGAVVGNFCMDIAIQKAKTVGVGWVSAKGSNHYGIAAMYPLRALKQGLIGMSFTNTSPLMSPTRSTGAALGTNPLSVAAPGDKGDSFVLDMATTAVAVGKIEIQRRKQQPIPEGWAQDSQGQITTDADVAYKTGCLMPLGGAERNSGYKGFGLGLLTEVFCGILAGAHYGPNIRRWGDFTRPADLGQCFVAIDPKCFAPGFEGRMSDLLKHIREMTPSDPTKPVMVAGDPERLHMQAVDAAGGIRYVRDQMDTCQRLSRTYNIPPMKPLA